MYVDTMQQRRKMGHKATADNMEYCVFLMACYAIYISSVT